MESNVLQYILTNMQVFLYAVIHSQCLDFSNDFSSQMSRRIISSHLKLGFQLFCELRFFERAMPNYIKEFSEILNLTFNMKESCNSLLRVYM